jgi:hypothetical protein
MLRREFLAAGAGTLVASAAGRSFEYRGYLGWITDLATQPDPVAEWPSMRLDESLLRDYRETSDLMQQLGMQNLCVWGLYVSRAWPVDLKQSVTPERGAMVEKLIGAAHAKGLRVLSGLGVYSWGFDEILRANPSLMKSNVHAMCGSEDASWEWMQKVIDYVFTRFPIDGVSMQSADQGRCTCERCRRFTETEYHVRLNIKCARYIRSRWPGKTIGVSGWGMRFEDAASLPHLAELGKHIDYLIDVPDSAARRGGPQFRKRLIEAVPCAFGTLGGPQVEPPQHWARDRWFLPTLHTVGEHLEALHADGGRACEWFYHVLANPGCELSTHLVARTLADPGTPWRKHLMSSIEQIYEVTNPGLRDGLAEAFLAAEDAYTRNLPAGFCGTISMEPLVSSAAGPPVYLTKRLTADQRHAYSTALVSVRKSFDGLMSDVPEKGRGRGPRDRIRFILRSIDNVQRDLTAV